MNSEIVVITDKLRSLGVNPAVLKLVREEVRKASAPAIDAPVTERLRETVAQDEKRRAILVLGRNGSYSVFSVSGHAALCASAKRNKPWESSKHRRADSRKNSN